MRIAAVKKSSLSKETLKAYEESKTTPCHPVDLDQMQKEIRQRERWDKKHPVQVWIRNSWWYINPFANWNLYTDIKYFFKNNWFFLWHGFFPADWYEYRSTNAKRTAKLLRYYRDHSNHDLTWNQEHRDFAKALDLMIEGFEILAKDDSIAPMIYTGKKKEALEHVKKYNHEYRRQITNHYKAQTALQLYAKYYEWLWD